MASKITFSNILHCTVKSPSEIPKSRTSEGRLPAGSVINKLKQGDKIDVVVVKESPTLLCDNTIELDENSIRERLTFDYEDVSKNSFVNQRLPVGTKFFKNISKEDSIYLILH